mgnify:CR=1 FL=1
MSEDLGSLEANQQIKDETLVALLIRCINNSVQCILGEGDHLVIKTEHIELLKVGCQRWTHIPLKAAITDTASGMRAITEQQLQSIAVIAHQLIKSELSATSEAHPLIESMPVMGFHGVIEDGDVADAGQGAMNHTFK